MHVIVFVNRKQFGENPAESFAMRAPSKHEVEYDNHLPWSDRTTVGKIQFEKCNSIIILQ